MKSVFVLLLMTIFVSGCQENQEKEVTAISSTEETAVKPQNPQSWEQEITLHEGAQWKANRETTEGILQMSNMTEEFTASSPQEFRALGDALNEEKNLLIKRCTMTGASHANLHIYLQPLLAKIAELQETSTREEGEQLLQEIKEHLSAYHSYFI